MIDYYKLIGYIHPTNHYPITDLKYKIIKLSDEELRQLEQTENKEWKRKRFLWISYKYETGNYAPNEQPRKDGHRPVLCPFMIDGVPCGCFGYARYGPIRSHDCITFPPKKRQPRITDSFVPVKELNLSYKPLGDSRRTRSRQTEQQLELLGIIIDLLAGTSISLRFLCSRFFFYWLGRVVGFGQRYANLPLQSIIPQLSQRKLSDGLLEKARDALLELREALSNKYVSIMFDGTKVNHKKYVAITVCTHEQDAKPIFLSLVKAPQTKPEFSVFVREVIQWLKDIPCEVTSICTDGLRAQVSGIKHAFEVLKKDNDEELTYIPFHVPCMNHLINLVTVHTFDYQPTLEDVRDCITTFSDKADNQDRQEKLKKRCPLFIKSRWLSLSLLCSYIRLKRGTVISEEYLTSTQMKSSVRLEILLTPLSELHLFLENDTTKLHQVFPALIRAVLQYKLMLTHPGFYPLEWASGIAEILRLLYCMIFSSEIGGLVALAFVATPIGQYLYSKQEFVSGYNINMSLEEARAKLFVHFLFFLLFEPMY